MTNLKQRYDVPATTVLVVRFEDNLLLVSTQSNRIQNATLDTWEDEL